MHLLEIHSNPAVAEARALHGGCGPGRFIAIARHSDELDLRGRRKFKQSFYSAGAVEGICTALGSAPDTYMSQASFVSPRRITTAAHSINCAFVDLDAYNVGLGPDAAAQALEKIALGAGLPLPTLIVSSGRGIYAKWIFDTPVSASLLPRWVALENVLAALFDSLGADANAKDPSRVLRVLGSTNTKAGDIARILNDTGQRHSFAAMCQIAQGLDIPVAMREGRLATQRVQRARGVLADEPTDLGLLVDVSMSREPVLLKAGTLQSLNWARFLDLRDLVLLRGGIERGNRDKMLLWMASTLSLSGVITGNNFMNEITELVQCFPKAQDFDPLADGSMSTLLRRSNAHHRGETVTFARREWSPVYTPRNDTLINILGITDEEQTRMRTIISRNEKDRRRDARCPGRAERRVLRRGDACTAVVLSGQGESVQAIAGKLGRSTSTIYRWLKPDEHAGQPYVETRGRKQKPQALMTERERELRKPRPRQEKIRPPKCQHAGPVWSSEKTAAWLESRQEIQRRAREIAADTQAWLAKVDQAQKAQTRLRMEIRLERMRSKSQRTQQDRFSACSMYQSVASAPVTGPPAARLLH